MSELLPCPFCSSDRVVWFTNRARDSYRVLCDGCGIGTDYYSTKEQAVSAWNRRATDPVQQRAAVAGEYMQRSHGDFERGCEVAIGELVEQPNPPNHIVALLCDAVRVSRECCRLAQTGIASTNTATDPAP